MSSVANLIKIKLKLVDFIRNTFPYGDSVIIQLTIPNFVHEYRKNN